MQIHYLIATLKKENSSITDYSHQFTSFANTLATIDQTINDLGVFGFLLAGLESEYDSFVTEASPWLKPQSNHIVIEASQ